MATLNLRDRAKALDTAKGTEALPGVPRDRLANLQYLDKKCTVLLTVPNGEQVSKIARLSANLAGVPWETLSPLDRSRFRALARYVVCVSDTPEWLDVSVEEDEDLLFSIIAALEEHTDGYFRRGDGENESAEGASRLAVTFADNNT